MKSQLVAILLLNAIVGCSTVNLGVDAYNTGQYDKAAYYWNDKAIAGDPAAQNNLGLLWENGLDSTPKNLNQAAEWYLRAAKQNLPVAMVNLARVQYALGYGDAAVSWLHLAARWGYSDAVTELRRRNLNVPQSDLLAAQQTQDAADAEALGALIGLAIMGAVVTDNPEVLNSPALLPSMTPSPSTSTEGLVMCPDGTYVMGRCNQCSDGSYVGGTGCRMAPTGDFVRDTGTMPQMAPDGTYVPGGSAVIMCPDGSFVSGKYCRLAPDGTYVGSN